MQHLSAQHTTFSFSQLRFIEFNQSKQGGYSHKQCSPHAGGGNLEIYKCLIRYETIVFQTEAQSAEAASDRVTVAHNDWTEYSKQFIRAVRVLRHVLLCDQMQAK